MSRDSNERPLPGITVSHLHGLAASVAGPGDFKTFKPVCPGTGRIRWRSRR